MRFNQNYIIAFIGLLAMAAWFLAYVVMGC